MLDAPATAKLPGLETAVVQFHNVNYSINKNKLIHDASCQLDLSGITVVMGPNGAGKSLFLRLIAGLLEPDSGRVQVCMNNRSDNRNRCISLVFQNPVLLRRSVHANVAFALKQQRHPVKNIDKLVKRSLMMAQLEHYAETPARHLSGGEQQRLAMARALVVTPAVLLLDEATANLDPASTYIVEKMVENIARNGTKVIFVTHDVRQAKRMGDDILFISNGRIMIHKDADEFFLNPDSQEAQSYLDGRVPNSK